MKTVITEASRKNFEKIPANEIKNGTIVLLIETKTNDRFTVQFVRQPPVPNDSLGVAIFKGVDDDFNLIDVEVLNCVPERDLEGLGLVRFAAQLVHRYVRHLDRQLNVSVGHDEIPDEVREVFLEAIDVSKMHHA